MGRQRLTLIVGAGDSGTRLDAFLGRREELGSRTRVAGLIEAGAVMVDGAQRPKSYQLVEGQTVVVEMPSEKKPTLAPEAIPVPILFEDEWLMVVDKPAGMVIHPSRGHASGTLVNALLEHGAAGGEAFRP
ncbi:MAG TPA: hypothetical protein VJP78_02360, partial [Thermoleophilia bacterium]|nr:hypothetical protein [Thermoleophilia bacterium]